MHVYRSRPVRAPSLQTKSTKPDAWACSVPRTRPPAMPMLTAEGPEGANSLVTCL